MTKLEFVVHLNQAVAEAYNIRDSRSEHVEVSAHIGSGAKGGGVSGPTKMAEHRCVC